MTSSAVAAAAASVSGRSCRKRRQPSFLFSCFSQPTVCDSVNSPSKPPSNAYSCMVMQRRSRTVPLTEEIAAINDAEAPENPCKVEKKKISRMPLICKPKDHPKLSRRDPVQTRKNSAGPTKPASKAPRRPDFPAAKFQAGPTKPGHLLGLKMVSIVVATILIGGKIFGIVVTTVCFYMLSSLRQPRS